MVGGRRDRGEYHMAERAERQGDYHMVGGRRDRVTITWREGRETG